jgi:TolB-like protein/Flp pilus assembly protein TadD
MPESRGLKVVASQQRPPASERLDSWKEIAAYLHKGARTVQRWEREAGLPVHRLQHDKLGSVYAYRSELDAWWAARGGEADAVDRNAPAPCASIAVLPFVDLCEAKDQAYFCEGIADEIIGSLSRSGTLRVVSRTSSFQFGVQPADVREIGKRLRVNTVLGGSVRKSGAQVRIAVELVDATTGYQVWSQRYDRNLENIFVVQDEIARSVADALKIKLAPPEAPLMRTPPTSNLAAYDYYLRGRAFYYKFGPQDMGCAVQLFTKAIELDPEFAQAYAGLADCWSYIYLYSDRSPIVLEQAGWAATKALKIQPKSAAALASRGLCRSCSGRDLEAKTDFESAIRLDPQLFEGYYFYARHCFARGDKEKAVRLYEAAMRVRPEDYQSPLLVAQSYEDLGRREQSTASRRRGVQIAEDHLRLYPDDVRALYMAANGLAALGDRARARELAGRALEMRPEDPMVLYNVACVFSMLGIIEQAIDLLAKANAKGLRQRGWYENDSNLDPLREQPRFQMLLRELD